jgi:hypothetical protein
VVRNYTCCSASLFVNRDSGKLGNYGAVTGRAWGGMGISDEVMNYDKLRWHELVVGMIGNMHKNYILWNHSGKVVDGTVAALRCPASSLRGSL